MPRRPAFRTRVRKVVELWIELFDEHELLTHASAIAFQVLKSLIPLSLLGIALLGEVGRRDIWATHLVPRSGPGSTRRSSAQSTSRSRRSSSTTASR
jgi:uncharacterized BrkB/YihY/UPF0761 family membrane protein